MANLLTMGIKYATSNPSRWKVVTDLWQAPTKANVIRHATTKKGFFPHVMKCVDKDTGILSCTTRSYRNAEITHHNGRFIIEDTCSPNSGIRTTDIQLNSLSEVVAYFKPRLAQYSNPKYNPIR